MQQMLRAELPSQTGLVCAACQQPIATVGYIGPQGVTLHCPGCGHQWALPSRTAHT